jgi:glucose-6-phosphate 1-dehydrogenase
MATKVSIFSMDLAKADDYMRLKDVIALGPDDQLLVYLSVPPGAAAQIVDFMGEAGINSRQVKLLFEKPFGVDYESATGMITRTARYYSEDQIYRIDHYLAKEMAQNIIAFRGGNAMFAHIWNNNSIEKIEIIASEKIGIEGRAGFYEQTGALRDFLQGHLMQLLALTLMDIPSELDWDRVPELRLKALQSIQPATPDLAQRAQYDTYQSEAENSGSTTETFVSVELASSAPKWKGVPLHLITGKALDKKTTEVRIHFRKQHAAQSNCLTLHIQPNEGVEVELFTKKPGYERQFESQKLAFTYPEDTILPDAYEQVIVDAIRSHKSLFTSSDEVLASWRVLQPLLDAWSMQNEPLRQYATGSEAHEIRYP